MSIKNDIADFLRLYADLTGSVIGESEDLIHLELSPIEKRKHLLSQIKFSFSKEVCERENAELLTVSNKTYRAILSEAKEVGIVAVGRSFEVDEPVIVLSYLLLMACQNHIKEEIRELSFRIADCGIVPSPVFWSETDPCEASNIIVDNDSLVGSIREAIMKDISEPQFRFEDEMERRQDRERVMIDEFYNQRRKERIGAASVLEKNISEFELKIANTKSMKVYNSSKKQIEQLRIRITSLEDTKARDIEKIINEYNLMQQRIKERYVVQTNIDLINALIVMPTNP